MSRLPDTRPLTGTSRRGWLRGLSRSALLVGLAGPLAACGFHMRRATQLPFSTLYTNLAPNGSIGLALRRELSNADATHQARAP